MRTHTHKPSRFPQRLPVLVVLISFWPAGACVAQEENQLNDNSLFVSDAEETSPQEKAAQAAEAAQRRQQQLLGQRQQREQLQQQQQVAEQHAKAEEAYRNAVSKFEELTKQLEARQNVDPHRAMLEQQRAMLEKQLSEVEAKRADLAQQMSQLQPQMMMNLLRGQQNAPLPRDGTFKVFSLRNSRAADAARILSEILGGAVTRMAVDERTNSLLVFGDEDTMKIVEGLTLKLDERSEETNVEMARPGETLQLRIVWLLDIDEGIDPTPQLVSPQVVEALHELGFVDPKVVCQQVTTLTLSDDTDRQGHFNFDVPVLVKSQQWQLEGQGQIESMADERFKVRFDMRFHHGDSQRGQLGGSIYTPLSHYTVMGTTTFVRTDWNANRDAQQAPPEKQHLSAFVVYLDRAREFPAPQAPSNNRTDVRR